MLDVHEHYLFYLLKSNITFKVYKKLGEIST